MISSTFFTASPHWRWFIVGYFFLGGLAAGSYFLATLLDLFARGRHRGLVNLGYLIAFPLVCVCGFLLTIDLGRPERFWHMLVQSETFRPMIKTYSPMSLGAWALLLFGGCAFVSFLAVLAERGWLRWRVLRWLSSSAPLGRVVTVIGMLLGFYVGGYTGVLLAVTNRPIWADTNLIGLTFLVSAASTSAALLALVGSRDRRLDPGLDALERFDIAIVALEVLVIAALIASLGPIAVVWLNGWGVLLAATLLAMVLGGLALPLYMRLAARGGLGRAIGSALVLLSGFIFRAVIVFSVDRLS
jgi:formate-dependent nitrite reductase membrane component NrfD